MDITYVYSIVFCGLRKYVVGTIILSSALVNPRSHNVEGREIVTNKLLIYVKARNTIIVGYSLKNFTASIYK